MSEDQVFQTLTAVSAALAWTFVVRYGFWSPWRETVVGRSLMYVWVSLTVVLTLITLSFWFGDYPGRFYVRLVVYSTLPLAFASFLRVLVQVQHGRHRTGTPETVDADLRTPDESIR